MALCEHFGCLWIHFLTDLGLEFTSSNATAGHHEPFHLYFIHSVDPYGTLSMLWSLC